MDLDISDKVCSNIDIIKISYNMALL